MFHLLIHPIIILIGFSSSQYPLTTSWLAEVYNAGYAINNSGQIIAYTVQHASTIGQYVICTVDLGGCVSDSYWHINWVWGVPSSTQTDRVTAIEVTPIGDLGAWQVNGQELTASSSYRTVCVVVTNFQGIVQAAGSESGDSLGYWISEHPIYDGVYWQLVQSGTCSTITSTYANYNLPNNTQLW